MPVRRNKLSASEFRKAEIANCVFDVGLTSQLGLHAGAIGNVGMSPGLSLKETASWMVFERVMPFLIPCRFRTSKTHGSLQRNTGMVHGHSLHRVVLKK